MTTNIPTKSTEVDAIVYPICRCGKPWVEHGDCGGYVPITPVLNYGTVDFSSKDPLATIYWKIESFFQRLRKRRVRSL